MQSNLIPGMKSNFLAKHSGSISILTLTTVLTLAMVSWMGFNLRDLNRKMIAGSVGDTQLNAWTIYQAMDNLLHRPTDLGYSTIFYGDTNSFAYTIAPYGIAVLSLPVYVLSGGNLELSYNLYFIATYALTAWAVYLLVSYLFNAPLPVGLIAGLVVAFAQFRLYHYMHIETMSTQYYALALYCLHRLIDRPRWRWALGLGITAWLTIATSGNLTMGLIVTAAIIGFVIVIRRPGLLTLRLIRFLAITAILLAVALWPIVRFRYGNPVFARGFDYNELLKYSGTPQGWLSGTSLLYSNHPYLAENTLLIGITPLLLSIAAWALHKRSVPHERDWVLSYAIVIVVGYLLTLGPQIRLSESLTIPTPYALLIHLPGFSLIRVSCRYILLPMLGTALLSAYALTALYRRLNRRLYAVVLMAVAIALCIELLPNPDNHDVFTPAPPKIDLAAYPWLAQQPPNTPIVEYPTDDPGIYEYVGQERSHGQPMLTGMGSYIPDWFYRLNAVFFPTPETLDFIWQRGVKYVLIHTELMGNNDAKLLETRLDAIKSNQAVLAYVKTFDKVVVYEVRAKPQSVPGDRLTF